MKPFLALIEASRARTGAQELGAPRRPCDAHRINMRDMVELEYSFAPDRAPVVTLECTPDFSIIDIVPAPDVRHRVSRLEAIKGVSLAIEDGRLLRFKLQPMVGNDAVELE